MGLGLFRERRDTQRRRVGINSQFPSKLAVFQHNPIVVQTELDAPMDSDAVIARA